MKKSWMSGAAVVIAASAVMAQSVLAVPIKELDPIAKGWGDGARRGSTSTETMRELEPIDSPAGGASAQRGWVALESLRVARFGTLVVMFDGGSLRRALFGR